MIFLVKEKRLHMLIKFHKVTKIRVILVSLSLLKKNHTKEILAFSLLQKVLARLQENLI